MFKFTIKIKDEDTKYDIINNQKGFLNVEFRSKLVLCKVFSCVDSHVICAIKKQLSYGKWAFLIDRHAPAWTYWNSLHGCIFISFQQNDLLLWLVLYISVQLPYSYKTRLLDTGLFCVFVLTLVVLFCVVLLLRHKNPRCGALNAICWSLYPHFVHPKNHFMILQLLHSLDLVESLLSHGFLYCSQLLNFQGMWGWLCFSLAAASLRIQLEFYRVHFGTEIPL